MEDVGCFEGVNGFDCVLVLAFDTLSPRMSAISSLHPFSIHV